MPRFSPFRGVRYDPARFAPADVTAPPYDVISPEDRRALVSRDPHNAVLIDAPTEADGPDRYAQAGARMQAWMAEGALVTDPQPTLTAYRMTTTDDQGNPVATLGVLGALTLGESDEGGILPHEHTTKKATSDRLDLLRGTRANLSAIWGLSLAKGLTDLLGVTDTEPDATWEDEDGVRHETWRIDDPARTTTIADAIATKPVVIADGHHRFATCLAYRDERRGEPGSSGDAGEAEATLCYVVELTDDQLTVRPIHRLVDGRTPEDLVAALAEHPGFEIGATVPAAQVTSGQVLTKMADEGAIAVVGPDGRATLLIVDPAAFEGADDLDSARLASALDHIGGCEVTYQHGVDRVQAAVAEGRAQAGVLIRPVTVAAIEANAHSGNRMPPKSTFFHPKPRTGIVYRML